MGEHFTISGSRRTVLEVGDRISRGLSVLEAMS